MGVVYMLRNLATAAASRNMNGSEIEEFLVSFELLKVTMTFITMKRTPIQKRTLATVSTGVSC